jgi:hypothetical protein
LIGEKELLFLFVEVAKILLVPLQILSKGCLNTARLVELCLIVFAAVSLVFQIFLYFVEASLHEGKLRCIVICLSLLLVELAAKVGLGLEHLLLKLFVARLYDFNFTTLTFGSISFLL